MSPFTSGRALLEGLMWKELRYFEAIHFQRPSRGTFERRLHEARPHDLELVMDNCCIEPRILELLGGPKRQGVHGLSDKASSQLLLTLSQISWSTREASEPMSLSRHHVVLVTLTASCITYHNFGLLRQWKSTVYAPRWIREFSLCLQVEDENGGYCQRGLLNVTELLSVTQNLLTHVDTEVRFFAFLTALTEIIPRLTEEAPLPAVYMDERGYLDYAQDMEQDEDMYFELVHGTHMDGKKQVIPELFAAAHEIKFTMHVAD
ncbi:hypothetical protein SVAN01_11598 [Stagonosporopsis vannaccii]|nr:hypothetical protein SVAN01_11598 [Stagonosporopsis vannaccii]